MFDPWVFLRGINITERILKIILLGTAIISAFVGGKVVSVIFFRSYLKNLFSMFNLGFFHKGKLLNKIY